MPMREYSTNTRADGTGEDTSGRHQIGSAPTSTVECVLVAKGAATPAGLPTGTLVFEKST